MSNYVKLAAGATDQYLGALAQSQDTFLKSVAAYSAAWTPAVAAPAFGELPTPQEITEASFAFATKMLKQQKDFAEKLIESFSPQSAS